MATYTVISQNTTTGKVVETRTYDTLEYAQIHYDASEHPGQQQTNP